MKYLLLSASLLTLTALPAMAQEPNRNATTFSGNAAIVSDYRVRGISRSDEGPAIQGSAQINHPAGPFIGASASTVDMNIDSDANVEGILFGGLQGNIAGMDYDARLNYTTYPGGDNDDADYWELVLNGGYDFGPAYGSLTWAISPNYINDSGVSLYYGADLSAPLPIAQYDLTAKGHLGFEFVGDEDQYQDSGTIDWSLGLWYNYTPYDLDIGLEYVDTNLDSGDCAENCGATALLTVKKPFGF